MLANCDSLPWILFACIGCFVWVCDFRGVTLALSGLQALANVVRKHHKMAKEPRRTQMLKKYKEAIRQAIETNGSAESDLRLGAAYFAVLNRAG